jgi:hypothetical protein
MTTATFDTLKFANRLKQAGVPDRQTEAEAEALAELMEVNLKDLVTKTDLVATCDDLKRDIKELELKIEARLEAVRGEFTLAKWMLGLLLGGVIALILKTFFPI